MRDASILRSEARRSYEVGRLRFAVRVAGVIVPLTAVSAWETGALVVCGLTGASLLTLAIAMRWWHRRGVDAVSSGLQAGAVPAFAALVVCRLAPSCPPNVALGLCVTAGLVSGAIIGRATTHQSSAPWRHWGLVAVIGTLTAMLGCIGLGVGTVLGAGLAIAVATAAATALSRSVAA